ncbi:hypothetical protein [Sphingobacterium sp. LRF_L2]|uniref:hypothetical protein n=1 Tax=Sphingobacterium sp. LRF_L2 TaxID=3369421 RepID=UPI003F61052C
MNTTQVKVMQTAPRKSWTDKLLEMEVGATIHVDMRSASTVRGEISARMPIRYPDLKFETKKIKVKVGKEETPVIEIKRTA